MATKWNWKETPAGKAVQGKGAFTRFVGWLNSLFNENHPWFDYGNMGNFESSVTNQITQEGLTGAQREANAFTASEAQKQRDWETDMSNTAYQRQVADMRAAGVNPAMAMSGTSGASTPSGASATSVAPGAGNISFQDILSLVMLPLQRKLLEAQARQARDMGNAALINANANAAGVPLQAEGNEIRRGELGVKEYEAKTNRIRSDIERFVARTNARMTDKQIEKMSHEIAYIDETKDYISKNYEVAVQNADAHQKQALAALRSAAAAEKSAQAAVQNAATNDYLAGYQSDVLFSTQFLNGLLSKEKQLEIDFLPEKYRVEIDEMRSRGYFFDQQGRLVDKTGKLVEAQTAETYTRMATEITHATCEIVNTVVGVIPGKSPAPIGFNK